MTGTFSEAERREIAGRARTLHERLSGPPNEVGPDPPFDPEELFAEWRDLFPDESAFADRLERGGLSKSAIREQMAATRWPADRQLPDWIDELERLVRHVETTAPRERVVTVGEREDGKIGLPEDTPFAELVARVVEYAVVRLPENVPFDVIESMARWIGSRIERCWTRALYVEFKTFVSHHDPELARADPGEFEDPPTELYEAFVDAMVDGGFRDLHVEYPVLARRLVRLLDQWIEAVTELYERIETDRDALADRFDVDGRVTDVEPLADDVHAEGRAPARVRFESGSVVYKPRPVDAGVVLYEIFERLDDHLPLAPMPTPEYLPRPEYGWMEEIEYRDPDDEAAVERYYERAGTLLCTAYALNLSDCQFENIIVSGEFPMVLDAETILHPFVRASATTHPTGVAKSRNDSVLLTSMLPWTATDPNRSMGDDESAPTAGFGNVSGEIELSDRSHPSVEGANTDVMAVERRSPTIDRTSNVPTVDGEDHLPGDHVEAIVRGFERTYETLEALQEDGRFLSDVLDRDLVDGIEHRLVYRGTRQYGSVLRSATARKPLRDGARSTIEFEDLAVPFFDGRVESDRYWPLYAAERRSLRRGDVPRFTADPTGTGIDDDGTAVGRTLDASGYERCRRRLESMDATDRRRQVWLIRGCLQQAEYASPNADPVDLTDGKLTDRAVELGDAVVDAALETDAGRRWVSFDRAGYPSSLAVLPTDVALYNGRSGIGLAFAGLYEATGRDRFRKHATDVLDAIVDEVGRRSSPLMLGGTAGLGSVVYALSVADELLDVRSYRRTAEEVAKSVTEEYLANDDVFDVMAGSAGTLLALLAYYDRNGGSEVLDRATACGERLLDARVTVDGYRVWQTIHDDPGIGFAHGSSGIAYALARLAAVSDDDRYEMAAREALAYESSLYDAGRRNWVNPGRDGSTVDRWCYGRSGIALARLGIGTHLGDEALLAEEVSILSKTAADGLDPLDTLCCGNLGRAVAMLEAARRTDAAHDDAREYAARCLARKERDGSLSLPGHSELVTNPTFFNGAAGAAYALLRLRNPDSLPCVLLLE